MGGLRTLSRAAALAVVALALVVSGAGGAGAAQTEGAPLRTDACTLLTNAEVIAFANSIGGTYKVSTPLRVKAAPAVGAPDGDAQHHHYCTWGYDQATAGGSTANDGHVAVTVRRIPPDEVGEGCRLFGSHITVVPGVGDHAERGTAIGCVRVGDVSVDLAFDGATEKPVDGGAMVATLRKLAQIDEPASPVSTDTTATTVPRSAIPRAAVQSTATLTPRQAVSRVAVATGRRSSVPASLSTPSEAFTNPSRIAQNALLAALLVLLLVFPSQLFNSTFDKHHDRIQAAWRKRLGVRTRAERPADAPSRASMFVAVAAAGALISLFLNPHLKLNAASTAQFAGVLATILFGTAVAAAVHGQFRRLRDRPTRFRLDAVPSGLAIAVACVVVSRLVHFQPGYLYGLVGGVVFAVALTTREEGQSEFAGFFAGLVVALVAWMVFVPVSSAANHLHPSFLVLVADSFVAAVFIGGIEGALFALVPVRFLPGHKVAQWSWPAWVVMAAVTAFLFVNVLLRPENGYLGQSSTASAVVTYGLFTVFGVASVAFWGWFRLHPDATPSAEREVTVSA